MTTFRAVLGAENIAEAYVTIYEGCELFDFDGDSDTNLIDWGAFQVAFPGAQ